MSKRLDRAKPQDDEMRYAGSQRPMVSLCVTQVAVDAVVVLCSMHKASSQQEVATVHE